MLCFDVSFYCYYSNGNVTRHTQELFLNDIPRWIESYKFTHPDCTSISCKVWFD